MNLDEIQQTIPNRPPYLWVDEVVSLDREQIHTRKHLNPELPVFAAHSPYFRRRFSVSVLIRPRQF